jgi:hypothetical protein
MIDITKPVRTKCGDHVQIISDKGKPPYLLIGYVGRGTWDIESWRLDGRHSEDGASPGDLENYEPEPWKLPDPPAGQKWHRDDWTEDMLPEGYRPLLLGETRESEDEFLFEPYGCASKWRISGGVPSCVNEADPAWCHHRTKRPLPEPKPEEWAVEKAAFVEGRAIEFQPKGFNKWFDCPEPTWSSDFKYRIKPELQWVPMEPCDVPCLSLIKAGGVEAAVLRVSTHGVYICGLAGNIYEVGYDELFEDWQIKRPGGEWKPCKKEAQV